MNHFDNKKPANGILKKFSQGCFILQLVSTFYNVLYSKYTLVATSRSQRSLAIPLRPLLLRALLHYSIVPFLLMKHSPLTFK